jgi:hypothetical protein
MTQLPFVFETILFTSAHDVFAVSAVEAARLTRVENRNFVGPCRFATVRVA